MYNNIKNANTGSTPFKLNCGYHLYMFYIENVNFPFKFKLVDELLAKLKELMTICKKNFHYI